MELLDIVTILKGEIKMKTLAIVLILIFASAFACADEIDDLIPFIIKVESGGNPNLVSDKGAIGLLQITPIVLKEWNKDIQEKWDIYQQTYEQCKKEDSIWRPTRPHKYPDKVNVLFNINENVRIGEWYLRRLKDHYLKDNYTIERLLAAYNMGITKLKKLDYEWWRIGETRRYVKKIIKLYKQGKKGGSNC